VTGNAKVQIECIVAFHCNDGYAKAPQCYVISAGLPACPVCFENSSQTPKPQSETSKPQSETPNHSQRHLTAGIGT